MCLKLRNRNDLVVENNKMHTVFFRKPIYNITTEYIMLPALKAIVRQEI